MVAEVENYIREQNKLLENNSEFKTIIIRCSFKDDKVALKCCFTDIYDYSDKIIYALKNESTENTVDAIRDWVKHIVEGVHIVRELNDLIKKYQKECNSPVRVIYKFGYDSDDSVKIIDWDYNKVVIKLNKNSIRKLISYYNNIMDIIKLDDYICGVAGLIKGFNSVKLHTVVGATITGSTIDILTDNMIKRKDVIQMIESNYTTKGIQKIKSVFSIQELGIIAIFMWVIDFSYGIVDIELMDDKILNVQEDLYIRDRAICNAILSIYEIKAKELYSIFKINEEI